MTIRPLRLACSEKACSTSDGRSWARSGLTARVELGLARGKGVRAVQLSRLVLKQGSDEIPLSDLQQGMFEIHDLLVNKLARGQDFDMAIEPSKWILVSNLLVVVVGLLIALFGFVISTPETKKPKTA